MFIRKPRNRACAYTVAAAAIVLLAIWLLAADKAYADNPIEVQLDEEIIKFDQDPFLKDGTTLVQFRPLFEAMGLDIEWDPVGRVVTGTSEHTVISLTIGNETAAVNGKRLKLLRAPEINNGHTLVPVRFVGEATGALVAWNPYKPQILIYTEAYLAEVGLTKEQAQAEIDRQVALFKEAYEAQQAANRPPDPIPVPEPPRGDGTYKPAASDKIDINNLAGMYYGFRPDNGGYECGGICWDLYTFLPGKKVYVGAPPNGGPETLDCAKDTCSTYTIQNNAMKLGNGETLGISVKNGKLFIEDVEMTRVKTASPSLRLTGKYLYRGYMGLAGISAGSTSWSETITFYDNGTFKSSSLMLGSVEGGAPTQGAAGDDTTGSFKIKGNTIVLSYRDGTVVSTLFFLHEDAKDGASNDLQIGKNHYYED